MQNILKMNKILPRIFEVNKTIKSYRRVIWFYDLWSRFTESKAITKVMEIANLRNNQNVLEIACGTGIIFEQILLKNPTGYNVGVDISPDMLQKTKKRLQKTGSKNYELQEGNALNLNLNSNSCDILINNFMVDLMPEEILRTKRVLDFCHCNIKS
jgi:ubiquinone/menaquinone biosynthesis C-methylase UbiE